MPTEATENMLGFYDRQTPGAVYWASFAILFVGSGLEFFDFYIVGFLLAVLGPAWHLTYLESSIVLVSAGAGAILGALLFGSVSDRVGRKRPLICANLICAAAASSVALVVDGGWIMLAALRFTLGIGQGGATALQTVTMVELTPAPLRAKVVGLPIVAPSISALLASLTTTKLMAVFGWRGIALLGAAPLLTSLLIFVLVPESPRWLVARRQTERARHSIARLAGLRVADVPAAQTEVTRAPRAALAEVFQRPGRLWFAITCWLCLSTASYGVYLCGPTIASTMLHVSASQAARYFFFIALIGIAGRVAFSLLPSIIGHRRCGIAYGFGIALTLASAAVLRADTLAGIPAFVACLAAGALFYDGGFCSLGPHTAELFPTRLAARGYGVAQAANGSGKILGPVCLALIAGASNIISPRATEDAMLPAFLFLASCGALIGLCFALFARETAGRRIALDDSLDAGPSQAPAAGLPLRSAAGTHRREDGHPAVQHGVG